MSDLAVLTGVVLAVGVEQIDRHAADERLPDARHDVATGDAHRHLHPAAVGITHRLHRQIAWIGFYVAGVLDAVAVHRLNKVALGVEQPDGDKIKPLIAGCLAVIAGEDTQAAGVNRKALMETKFGAEVRDQRLIGPLRRRQVSIEGLDHLPVALQIDAIGGCAVEVFLIDASQHQTRVAADLLPELGFQVFEQRPGWAVPAEEQITGELRQPRQ